jgi:predicted nucleotidyltransferase
MWGIWRRSRPQPRPAISFPGMERSGPLAAYREGESQPPPEVAGLYAGTLSRLGFSMRHDPEDLARTLTKRVRARRKEAEDRLERAREDVERVLRESLGKGTIGRAWLVGTAVWGGAHQRSDVDVVVERLGPDGYGPLWDRLSQAAGMYVDLLRLEDLDEGFRTRVLAEGKEVRVR